VPAVTGGIGGMLAGHATGQRDERVFLVAQGASKTVYYAGGFLLLFVPQLYLSRGGGALLYRGLGLGREGSEYWLALASLALAGAGAFLLAAPLTALFLRLLERFHYRRVSWAALGLMIALVGLFFQGPGLLVMIVSAGIGLLPILFGGRRMNCLGIILLPVACNLSGIGPGVAAILGLTP
jgi:putative membrane protein